MITFLLVVIGAIVGALSGLVGIGGGVLLVPALVLLFNMTQYQAQGTSVALLVLPVGLLGALAYYKAGHVNIWYGILIAVGFFIGSYFGAKLAIGIPEPTLQKIFGFVLLVLAIKFIFFSK
jgi:uncharacterized membrane protein YfcA